MQLFVLTLFPLINFNTLCCCCHQNVLFCTYKTGLFNSLSEGRWLEKA